jgi:hypothetical protein
LGLTRLAYAPSTSTNRTNENSLDRCRALSTVLHQGYLSPHYLEQMKNAMTPAHQETE